MPDSIREQIVEAFSDRISAQRGGQIDAERCRDEDLPARVAWDLAESAERTTYGKIEKTLTISVGVLDRVDHNVNVTIQANQLLASLLEDALNQDSSLGGLCERIDYTESAMDYPAPGQTHMAVLVEFEIVYRTSNRSPYQQQ